MNDRDKENKDFYNRTHYYGFEDEQAFEDFLDEVETELFPEEDELEDDILISENF